MGVSADSERRRDRPVVGAFLLIIGLLGGLIVATVLVAAVNPGYPGQWWLLKGGVPFSLLVVAVVCLSLWLLGLRVWFAAAGALAVFAGSAILVLLLGYSGQPDRSESKAVNLAALQKVRIFPGAELRQSDLYSLRPIGDIFGEGFLNPSPGYSLEREYLLPAGTPLSEAAAHYIAQFRRNGWVVHRSGCGVDIEGHQIPACINLYADDGNDDTPVSVQITRKDARIVATLG
jgi:hypothetical protein